MANLLDTLIGIFSSDLAVDLGTANTIVSIKDKGIAINEPSVVALKTTHNGKKKVLAVGKEAKEMVGKTPENITAIRPMKDGVIADFDVTQEMIKYFIKKVHNRSTFISPRIIICVPYGLTQVERKAVKESALSAGAREVYLIEEPMAAAIGAGLNTQEAQGNLVIDIGGGTTEIGVISLGGLVVSKSIRVAGDKFDKSIVEYINKTYSLQIGERTAEEIKMEIGSAIKLDKEIKMFIKGKDKISGLLNTIEISSEDIREAIKEPVKEIGEALKRVLEETPADLAGDIVENGIVLTGGGALLIGLDKYLRDLVKLPVYVAEDPLLAVARGTGKALENIEILSSALNE